jgi:CheY-like chemotaxis protein
VDRATHGAEALEKALRVSPELVVCPLDLSVIDGARLAQILRANPRTSEVAFLYLLEDELDAPVGMDVRDRVVLAPWDEKLILEQLDASLERDVIALPAARAGHEVEGNLAQLSLLDLLQLFHLTKKSGTVRVVPDHSPAGTILVRDGEIIDASVPTPEGAAVEGAKALFRLMSFREGRFEFLPEDPGATRRIDVPTRSLLLEGVRQIDETARLRQQLPTPDLRLRLARPLGRLPPAAHPLTQDVLRATDAYSVVQKIVDHVAFPDYQVLRTLRALLQRGIVEPDPSPAPSAVQPESGPFSVDQVRWIREWAGSQHCPVVEQVRIPVVASDAAAQQALVEAIGSFPSAETRAFEPEAADPLGRLVPLVDVRLEDRLSVGLFSLPAEERFRPVWSVATNGMLGALVVLSSPLPEGIERTQAVRAFLASIDRPVAHVLAGGDGETPAATDEESLEMAGPLFVLRGASDADRGAVVRTLLARLVQ